MAYIQDTKIINFLQIRPFSTKLYFIECYTHYGDSMQTLIIPKLKLNLKKEININTISKIKLPKTTICVISTSKNNSVINTLSQLIDSKKIRIITNKNADSLEEIVKFLLRKANKDGTINTDVLLLTISPKYTNLLFKYLQPNYIIVNDDLKNVTLPTTCHLILNADNPNHQHYINTHLHTSYGFEISKNIFKNEFSNEKIKCPRCNQTLNYNYYYNEYLGDYYCSNCKIKRKSPSIKVTSFDDKKNIIVINDIYKITLETFNISIIYDILLLFTVSTLLNIDLNILSNILSPVEQIPEKYNINKRIVYVINTDCLNDTFSFIKQNKELKTIIIDLKQTKNLYEINFEVLKNNEIDKIICIGDKNYDVATRLKYSNINEDKIVAIKELDEAVKYINLRTEGNIYAVLEENKEEFNILLKGNQNGN